jgi:hypothetical protein
MRETDAKNVVSARGSVSSSGRAAVLASRADLDLRLAFVAHAADLADLIVRLLAEDDYQVERLIEASFAQLHRSGATASDAAAIRRALISAAMRRLRWRLRRQRLQRLWPSRERKFVVDGCRHFRPDASLGRAPALRLARRPGRARSHRLGVAVRPGRTSGGGGAAVW